MDYRQAYGAVLRECRKNKKWSQDALGFEAGVDGSHISLLELGHKSPTLDTMEKLAIAMGLNLSTMMLRMEDLISQKADDKSIPRGRA